MRLSRRHFTIGSAASLAFGGAARVAHAQGAQTHRSEVPGYGPLVPDPARLFDLPKGFRYTVISSAGEPMDDGYVTPDKFDGMGCFGIDAERVALVRNHELKPEDRVLGPTGGLPRLEAMLRAEAHFGVDNSGSVIPGGTSTMVFNLRTGRREQQYLSLVGTAVNCAGGATPWGSWLSCEESVLAPADVRQAHGWVFEVPSRHRGLVKPVPLTAMGRFRHEAAAVDPRTGIIYLTEDRDDGLFYRFIPNVRDKLAEGGRLQALALRDSRGGADTRNWSQRRFPAATPIAVRWIDLDDTASPKDDLRLRGHQAGAAVFARSEDIHFGSWEMFFTCTSGGVAKLGQIMRYRPSAEEGSAGESRAPGTLELFVESTDAMLLDYGDNLTVAPWGDLIVCEDRSDGEINHLRGVTPQGKIYTFAKLHANTELAGVCFDPAGQTMFVNVYRPGKTLAITGPWARMLRF